MQTNYDRAPCSWLVAQTSTGPFNLNQTVAYIHPTEWICIFNINKKILPWIRHKIERNVSLLLSVYTHTHTHQKYGVINIQCGESSVYNLKRGHDVIHHRKGHLTYSSMCTALRRNLLLPSWRSSIFLSYAASLPVMEAGLDDVQSLCRIRQVGSSGFRKELADSLVTIPMKHIFRSKFLCIYTCSIMSTRIKYRPT